METKESQSPYSKSTKIFIEESNHTIYCPNQVKSTIPGSIYYLVLSRMTNNAIIIILDFITFGQLL